MINYYLCLQEKIFFYFYYQNYLFMKKLILLFTGLFMLSISSAFAQDKTAKES